MNLQKFLCCHMKHFEDYIKEICELLNDLNLTDFPFKKKQKYYYLNVSLVFNCSSVFDNERSITIYHFKKYLQQLDIDTASIKQESVCIMDFFQSDLKVFIISNVNANSYALQFRNPQTMS